MTDKFGDYATVDDFQPTGAPRNPGTGEMSAIDSDSVALEASAPDSPVAKFVEKRGPGLHHVALKVPERQVPGSGADDPVGEPPCGAVSAALDRAGPDRSAGRLDRRRLRRADGLPHGVPRRRRLAGLVDQPAATMNTPNIWVGCTSQWKKYVPAGSGPTW